MVYPKDKVPFCLRQDVAVVPRCVLNLMDEYTSCSHVTGRPIVSFDVRNDFMSKTSNESTFQKHKVALL